MKFFMPKAKKYFVSVSKCHYIYSGGFFFWLLINIAYKQKLKIAAVLIDIVSNPKAIVGVSYKIRLCPHQE